MLIKRKRTKLNYVLTDPTGESLGEMLQIFVVISFAAIQELVVRSKVLAPNLNEEKMGIAESESFALTTTAMTIIC